MHKIANFPYSISSEGQIYREGSTNPLAQVENKVTGYLTCSLWKENKGYSVYPHILCATYYVANPDPLNKKWVNHKNGDKTDPSSGNLEWVTRSENMLHAYATGLCSQEYKKVLTVDEGEVALFNILEGYTLTSLAELYGVGITTLHNYVNRAATRLGLTTKLQLAYAYQKKLRNTQANESKKVKVVQCDLTGKPLKTYASLRDAASHVGVNSGNISNCLKGRAKTCGGFKWIYK
jgi:hypothetical protein